MEKMRTYSKTVIWAIKMALKIDSKIFVQCVSIGIFLALFPALSLYYNKEIVKILSQYLITGTGDFLDCIPAILLLGATLVIIGISDRFNGNFIYFLMYDSYYFGLESYYMDVIHNVEIKTLMEKENRSDHEAILYRCGALTDFMSSGCYFFIKTLSVISMLFVAAQTSLFIFFIFFFYILLSVAFNLKSADKLKYDGRIYNDKIHKASYYQESSLVPGIAKELRVYHNAHYFIRNWDDAYKQIKNLDRKFAKSKQVVSFLSGFGFYVFMIIIMAFCIFRVANNVMSVDVFLMLYAMGESISNLMKGLSSGFHEAYRGVFFLNIQRKFIERLKKYNEVDNKNALNISEPFNKDIIFDAQDISFSYDDEKKVLNDISFQIKKGQTVALVGVNGGGKTTLIKLILGLFVPTKGKLYYKGRIYDKYTREAITNEIGAFFQDFYLFHLTMAENVGIGDVDQINNTDAIIEAMKKGNAENLITKNKLGLNAWIGRDVHKDGLILSGGEKQRIAISRTYMNNKEIMIFDEPAAALDPIAEINQFNMIRKKVEGKTAILISHRVGFARMADIIYVLDNGRLVESGSHAELIEQGGYYSKLFNSQAQWYK